MAKPWKHAESSAKRFGGTPEDYIELHDFMDSSKEVFPDNRHRALTHNSWFIFVVEKVFGHNLEIMVKCSNCQGTGWVESDPCMRRCWKCDRDDLDAMGKVLKKVSVRDVAEQHILEDFGGKYIPSPQDYLEHMDFQPWMNNGIEGAPSSYDKISKRIKTTRKVSKYLD